MYCKKCGKQIVDDSKFCKYCGALVDESEYSANKFVFGHSRDSKFGERGIIYDGFEINTNSCVNPCYDVEKNILRRLGVRIED